MTDFNEERFGINRDETKNSSRHFVSVDAGEPIVCEDNLETERKKRSRI